MTFLTPISDREMTQINLYMRWEQAFRICSNVLTSQYPSKASELLQYNHTIQTASASYVWENIYVYDRKFHQHIGRHPGRVWNVILQQAWTMIFKDRLRHDHGGSSSQRGMNKRDRSPCRRFNKGKCTYGLSCKYDHRCSVPKSVESSDTERTNVD